MKRFLSLLILLISTCHANPLPEPYASIEVLPFDAHGWFVNAGPMEHLLNAKKPKIAIEVGAWLGLSTRFIAQHLAEGGKIYAIDTWLGSVDETLHQQDPRLPYLYQQFLSNTIHTGLCDQIVPVRMKSMEAAKALNVKADFIYLDGGHDAHSVTEDIVFWNLHLAEGGILCGDDFGWRSVQGAVVHCAQVLNKKLYFIGNFWWYE